MKAQKLPSGSYRVQITLDGKRVSVTANSEDEAIYQAMLLKTGKKPKPNGRTVGECIDAYIDSKENILSPKTIYVYRQIRNNGLAGLCDIPLSELTNQHIQVHINELALKRSAKTVINAHSLLVSVLNVYHPDFRVRTTLPKKQKKIKQLPTAAEIMQAVSGTDIELPCLLALWLGLRLSEIRGAKITDIKNGILTIHNTIITVGGKFIEKDMTKTFESTRQISVPQPLQLLIDALPEEQVYLTPLSGQAIYKRFKRILKENDLPDMTFHDLRHLNASIMLALGVPDKYAMERGGWSSPSVLKAVYQHTFSDERKAVDDKIDNYFISLLHTKMHTE